MSAFTTSYPNIVRSIVTEVGIVTPLSESSTTQFTFRIPAEGMKQEA